MSIGNSVNCHEYLVKKSSVIIYAIKRVHKKKKKYRNKIKCKTL